MARHVNAGPWYLWEFNKHEYGGLAARLHAACARFQQNVDAMRGDRNLRREVVTMLTSVERITYHDPDSDKIVSRIINLHTIFLREIADAWAEHIVARIGLRKAAAVQAFVERSAEFVSQAKEHNWNWALEAFKITTCSLNTDDCWSALSRSVIDHKVTEIQSIWGKAEKPEPSTGKRSNEPKPELLKGKTTLGRQRAAESLGITTRTLDRWVAQGKLIPIGAGQRKRYKTQDLNRLLNETSEDI